jgi:Iap family predicted aminopeptidase
MSWAPYYHPGGQYVVFTSNKLGFENFELFVVDAAGTREPVRVTHTPGFDGLPVFSPDGKKLCWTAGRTSDGKSQLFLAEWNHEAALAALSASPLKPPRGWSRSGGGGMSAAVQAGGILGGAAVGSVPAIAEITQADLKKQIEWLAAPERAGRGTGTDGARATAEWAASYFQAAGLKPLGAEYFQPFEFDAGVKLVPGANQMEVTIGGSPASTLTSRLDSDFRPIPFSDSSEVEGEVVFAGYGLSVPEDGKNTRYNSYDGCDVKGKIVLALRYVPESVEPQRRAQLNRYAGLRYKAMMARERGAKAILFATGPNSPNAGELVGLGGDGALAGSGVIAASISGAQADRLFAAAGKSLKDVQSGLDVENPHVEGSFALPGVRVKIRTGIEHVKKPDRNVLAVLPPAGTDEYVVVGAHYDHLGTGATGSSLARSGEEGRVHPGADDNASGTAAVLEMAAQLAAQPAPAFRRGVIFALWSGEEIGIIGSAAFVEKPPVPLEKIVAYVNFDMVGRLKDNKLSVQAVGSSKAWRRLLEKRNVAAGFQLVMGDDPYLPTDVTSFYPKKIPVLNFFTGAHEDYHRPSDTAEKIDFAGTERIAKFATQIVNDVATAPERPDFSRVERKTDGGGSRETLRAYLGTIPDYTQEVKGVKFSGVRAGSPAEKAGVQGGDVLVEFAGQKITNIYDYTYSLDAVKIGVPVKVVVERAGQRVDLTVTPEARK